jgi:alpha-amylase
MSALDKNEEMLNLFMDYETFGEHQTADSGILNFLRSLPEVVLKNGSFTFDTPSDIIEKYQPISAVHVPHPISWADEERDLSAWLGNELQEEAFGKLYDLKERMLRCTDPVMLKDWNYLQISDHFYYMCTKFFSDGEVHMYFNPYASPYEAFINYMNVLSDFRIRLNALVPESDTDREIAALKEVIDEKDHRLSKAEDELKNLKKKLIEAKGATLAKVEKKKTTKKTTGKANTKSKTTK